MFLIQIPAVSSLVTSQSSLSDGNSLPSVSRKHATRFKLNVFADSLLKLFSVHLLSLAIGSRPSLPKHPPRVRCDSVRQMLEAVYADAKENVRKRSNQYQCP